jgi:DNA-binding MarR family transcriptional regulator
MSKPLRSFRLAFSILKHLATHPNETPYRIERELKIDRSTVRAALKLLVKANLVTVAGKPRKLPTGLERKEYKVTPQGIVALLQAHPSHIELTKRYLRDLAEKNTQFLPCIFGKWEYFIEQDAEDLAYKYLLISVFHTENEIERLSGVASGQELKRSFGSQESMHRHDIYEAMLVRAPLFGRDESEKWGSLIKRDEDLLSMAEKEIARLLGEAEEAVEYWDSALKDLHGEESDAVSLVPGDPELEDTWEEFGEWLRYARAKALDEGRHLPTASEVTSQALRELLAEEGIRPPKKKSRKS